MNDLRYFPGPTPIAQTMTLGRSPKFEADVQAVADALRPGGVAVSDIVEETGLDEAYVQELLNYLLHHRAARAEFLGASV